MNFGVLNSKRSSVGVLEGSWHPWGSAWGCSVTVGDMDAQLGSIVYYLRLTIVFLMTCLLFNCFVIVSVFLLSLSSA